MSGYDLSREPGLGEQRDYRLKAMPLPDRIYSSTQPLLGFERSRNGPDPSYSVDSPTAVPPSNKVKQNEIEIQTAETIKTLDKIEKD